MSLIKSQMRRSRSPSAPLNVLVFTPTPTHPPIQGNRQRVFDLCRAMQGMGAELTILHYATEGVSPESVREMLSAWGDVELVFPGGFAHRRSLVRCYGIDDWFDPKISAAVHRICANRTIDVCVVNYAWYSKLFEVLPPETVCVIDSHDVFGGRAEYFSDVGLDPEWFHTSIEQESIGLGRANFVIAIQENEAEILRSRTASPVYSVGFLAEEDFLPLRKSHPRERLIVGYIGSGNPFNVASMRAFGEDLSRRPDIRAKIDVKLAGKVCAAFANGLHPFVLEGVTDNVAEFYGSVDVVINPMRGGTGLKIKSQEALSFGKPVVSSADAMTGIGTNHPGHLMQDNAQLLDRLGLLAEERQLLAAEAKISRDTFVAHRRSQVEAFIKLWSDVASAVDARRSRNIVQ